MTTIPTETTEPEAEVSTSPTPTRSSSSTGVRATPLTVGRPTRSPNPGTGQGSSTGSASGGPADPLDDLPTDTPSSAPDPEPELEALKLGKQPLREVFRGLAVAAGDLLHDRLARTEAELAQGVWLMSEPQAAGIADPLANVANRHAGAVALAPDLNDFIAAGVAAAAYLFANLRRSVQIRRAYKRMGGMTPAATGGAESAATEGNPAA